MDLLWTKWKPTLEYELLLSFHTAAALFVTTSNYNNKLLVFLTVRDLFNVGTWPKEGLEWNHNHLKSVDALIVLTRPVASHPDIKMVSSILTMLFSYYLNRGLLWADWVPLARKGDEDGVQRRVVPLLCAFLKISTVHANCWTIKECEGLFLSLIMGAVILFNNRALKILSPVAQINNLTFLWTACKLYATITLTLFLLYHTMFLFSTGLDKEERAFLQQLQEASMRSLKS